MNVLSACVKYGSCGLVWYSISRFTSVFRCNIISYGINGNDVPEHLDICLQLKLLPLPHSSSLIHRHLHVSHFASIYKEILELSYIYTIFQHSPPLVQPLIMMTFVLQNGQSPLYTASFNGHLDVVKTLIEAGANVNQGDKVGSHTCLYLQYCCNVMHVL